MSPRRLAFGTSVFAEMTALAKRYGAVNLGQGYPDFDGPAFVKEAAAAALAAGHNQYAPMPGVPALRHAIADHQRRFYGLAYDPESEVTVHAGATEGICAALLALLEPEDEVIVFEPCYDAYQPCLTMAGARARAVALAPPAFRLDEQTLEDAIGRKTRALLVNSPGNPPALAGAIRAVHQFLVFAIATPFQHAIAAALAAPDSFYQDLGGRYRARRDRLCQGLETLGFGVRPPEGAYFALADIRPLGHEDDAEFCRMLVERIGVAAIPVSAFGSGGGLRHLARFAFCKEDATVDEALRRLERPRG